MGPGVAAPSPQGRRGVHAIDDDVVARVLASGPIAGGAVCATRSISDKFSAFATPAVACSCSVRDAIGGTSTAVTRAAISNASRRAPYRSAGIGAASMVDGQPLEVNAIVDVVYTMSP